MNGFDLNRAYSVARKEVMHILRDPFTLVLALGLPVMLVTFFGYAIDFEVRDIKLAVSDLDQGPAARRLKEIFTSSGYFIPVEAGSGTVGMLDSGKADAALFIEPGFSRTVMGGGPVTAQFIMDGSDNSKAAAVSGYLAGIQRSAAFKLGGAATPEGLAVETRFLYNAELNSQWFTIPGLAAIIIGLLAILLTALTVAREWENGSMELLLSTPVRPIEIIAGKLAPYALLVLGGVFFVYLSSRFVFGVPFAGSRPLFLAFCLLYVVSALSQGLFISVATRQQQVAMQFAMIIGLLPSLLLSGFIFPVESMPPFFNYFTMILPPRWFMEAVRGIFLKGAGLRELALPFLALLALSAALLALALKKFKTDMEP
ncbi:MAG: ABC transporter permease [Elusimicrobia bacterium]|nr:ABC transporter permease [Elusimicrobiota bacterium]